MCVCVCVFLCFFCRLWTSFLSPFLKFCHILSCLTWMLHFSFQLVLLCIYSSLCALLLRCFVGCFKFFCRFNSIRFILFYSHHVLAFFIFHFPFFIWPKFHMPVHMCTLYKIIAEQWDFFFDSKYVIQKWKCFFIYVSYHNKQRKRSRMHRRWKREKEKTRKWEREQHKKVACSSVIFFFDLFFLLSKCVLLYFVCFWRWKENQTPTDLFYAPLSLLDHSYFFIDVNIFRSL